MKILLIEPFFTGSHKNWALEFKQFSKHQIEILSLPGYHWKWRMHGAAVTLAQQFLKMEFVPSLILATDMLDLNLFLSLTRSKTHGIPTAVYFHENQLTYPWSPTDADVKLNRDNHYAFINYTTALAADKLFFNSQYHRHSFLSALPSFLQGFPDYKNTETAEIIAAKSTVLPLGLNLAKFNEHKPLPTEKPQRCVVLWNHRWEYDKNPETFFNALFQIADKGIEFHLVVLGESYERYPSVFDKAKQVLSDKILHWGYAESFAEYARWLWIADLLPVTSTQDFFGASVVEAMYCNAIPFLPKRLAYPEHLPEKYHSTYFYEEEDFVNKLQRRIWDVGYLRVMDTQQYAQQYDWLRLSTVYDSTFAQLCYTNEPKH
jgi:glycosyltransferase involved in cell wall biosynthesis